MSALVLDAKAYCNEVILNKENKWITITNMHKQYVGWHGGTVGSIIA